MTEQEKQNPETNSQDINTTETVSVDAIASDITVETVSDVEAVTIDEAIDASVTNSVTNEEAPKDTLLLGDSGEIIWNDEIIAKLNVGTPHLAPEFTIIREELNLQEETKQIVTERLKTWLEETIHTDLFPLFRLKSAIETTESEIETETNTESTEPSDENTPSAIVHNNVLATEAKALAQKVLDNLGILNRQYVEREVAALSQDVRKSLRTLGIRFGRSAIYFPVLLKPKAARLNAILGHFADGAITENPYLPPVGVTSFEADETKTEKEYNLIGFRNIAGRAIRIDILDRVLDSLYEAQKEASGPIAMPQAVVSFLGVSNETAEKVVEALGWAKNTDEEGKVTWQFVRQKPQRRPRPERNSNDRNPSDRPAYEKTSGEGGGFRPKRDNNFFKRPDQRPEQGGKKRNDKGNKNKGPRDYSANPQKFDSDNPFAILASLKGSLQEKKD